jgi:hypothetical protein
MSDPAATPNAVLAAIHHVMEDLAKAGVGKLKTNQSQNFKYRGVDDVMDAVAPSLSRHKLVILPSVLEHNIVERESRSGGKVFHATLKLIYEFICPVDGSVKVVGPIYGEAMDSGDKAINKAMAIAYKYLCVQTFCIPITGDDPDANSHEVAGAQGTPRAESPQAAPAAAPAPRPPARQRESGKPMNPRPGGTFGYGKKYRDVPYNVMMTADLEWFLAAERTPQNIREKIVDELSWREYETAQLEAGIAAQRVADSEPLSDDIP